MATLSNRRGPPETTHVTVLAPIADVRWDRDLDDSANAERTASALGLDALSFDLAYESEGRRLVAAVKRSDAADFAKVARALRGMDAEGARGDAGPPPGSSRLVLTFAFRARSDSTRRRGRPAIADVFRGTEHRVLRSVASRGRQAPRFVVELGPGASTLAWCLEVAGRLAERATTGPLATVPVLRDPPPPPAAPPTPELVDRSFSEQVAEIAGHLRTVAAALAEAAGREAAKRASK